MSDEPHYQIIAIAPGGGGARAIRKVQISLEEAFDLDLATVLDAFVSTGVCIHTTGNLKEAKQTARQANRLGAEVLVLDQTERVLADSRKRPRTPTSQSQPAVPATKVGTEFELMSEKEARSPPEYRPINSNLGIAPSSVPVGVEGELESKAESAYMASGSGHIPASFSTPEPCPDTSSLLEDKADSAFMAPPEVSEPNVPVAAAPAPALQPSPAPAPVPSPAPIPEPVEQPPPARETAANAGAFNFDSLKVDELVSLDGGLKRSGKGRPERGSENFTAPFEPTDEERLELDNTALDTPPEDEFADNPTTGGGVLDGDDLPGEPVESEDEDLADVFSDQLSSDDAGKEGETGSLISSEPKQPSAMAAATSAAAQQAAEFTSDKADAVMETAHSIVDRLKDTFEYHRRTRILLGVVVALGVGGIFPAIHARSAHKTFFRPILQELSNAKALEKRGDELSEDRKPAAVQKVLTKLKVRYFAFTAVLWLALSGFLAFIWFRIT